VSVRNADRYVRRGGEIPRIYHGTLAGVTQAISDAQEESRFTPGVVISVWAVKGKERKRIREFVAGHEQDVSTA
jgi:hypothetical protein